jgi:hypothetical protein
LRKANNPGRSVASRALEMGFAERTIRAQPFDKSAFTVAHCLTNVAADKHFWIARFARIVRCACS